MVHLVPGVLHRYDPSAAPVPVVVDVSRSGREYPIDFRSPIPFSVLHDNVSMYVEDLWGRAPDFGATMLYALFPNTYVDTNRAELDIDPDLVEGDWPVPLEPTKSKRGLGLLKTKSRYGEAMHERKFTVAEVMARIENYHRPYHAELRSILDRLRREHGFVYQISCHCMSAVGAPTHPDPGKDRPDFCIGDVSGRSASPEFVKFLVKVIGDLGYSVTVNDPYDGGELNERYGDPANHIESVMVEINKKLFMDVKTFKKKPEFDKVKRDVSSIIEAIADRAREAAA